MQTSHWQTLHCKSSKFISKTEIQYITILRSHVTPSTNGHKRLAQNVSQQTSSLQWLMRLNLLSCTRCCTASSGLHNTICRGGTFSLFIHQSHTLTLVMLPMQKLLVVNESGTLWVHQFLAKMFTLKKIQHHQTLRILQVFSIIRFFPIR